MVSELLTLAALLWAAGAILALVGASMLSRILLVVGVAAGILAAIVSLPAGSPTIVLPNAIIGEAVSFRIDPEGLWLMGFGLLPAGFACALASPSARGARGWLFGAAMSLLGALGVFGLQNGAALLIAWELMSLGGAVMIVGENLEPSRGRTVLFMLALLEVGAVALVLAIAILGVRISSLQLSDFNRRSGRPFPARTGRNGPPLPRRIRGQARSPPVLRVVSRSLWLWQRRVGGHHVGRRPQCCLLRTVARPVQLATGRAGWRLPRARHDRYRRGDAQRNSHHSLCVPAR